MHEMLMWPCSTCSVPCSLGSEAPSSQTHSPDENTPSGINKPRRRPGNQQEQSSSKHKSTQPPNPNPLLQVNFKKPAARQRSGSESGKRSKPHTLQAEKKRRKAGSTGREGPDTGSAGTEGASAHDAPTVKAVKVAGSKSSTAPIRAQPRYIM